MAPKNAAFEAAFFFARLLAWSRAGIRVPVLPGRPLRGAPLQDSRPTLGL